MNDQLCILDIETTGFEPEDSEILELYILKVVDNEIIDEFYSLFNTCLLYTSPSPRDRQKSRMPSSA